MNEAAIMDIPQLRILGRYDPDSARAIGAIPLFWAGSGLDLCFTGSELRLCLEADFTAYEPWIAMELNGSPILRMPLAQGARELCLFRGMTPGVPKRVRIFKETQPMADDPAHRLWLRGLSWKEGEFLPLPEPACRLEFIGDSLTSGEGVVGAIQEEDWIPPLFSASQTWARKCADLMGADFRLISQSGWGIRSGWDNDPRHTLPGIYDQVCAAASGPENRRAGARLPCRFEAWQPDAILINLGTNDAGAMGNPPFQGEDGQLFRQTADPQGLELLTEAAVNFLAKLRRFNPSAKLIWTYGMVDGPLRPQLEEAVRRFDDAWYLPLSPATERTMGSRRHPGPLCHQSAAETAAEFLKMIL